MDITQLIQKALSEEISATIEEETQRATQEAAERIQTAIRKKKAELVLRILSHYEMRLDQNRLVIQVSDPFAEEG